MANLIHTLTNVVCMPFVRVGSQHGASPVDVVGFANALRQLDDTQLRRECDALRLEIASDSGSNAEHYARALAFIFEALRRTLGIELYDVQLIAALALARGDIAEMQTGEGKTLSCGAAAFSYALRGRGVHVVTPNQYLAERDCEQLRPAFELLGLSVSLLPEKAAVPEKRAAYLADVTYGSAYEFGFDYLRDQLELRKTSQYELGQTLLNHLDGAARPEQLMQRGLAYAIVDEIDDVLIDDARSPLVLSTSSRAQAPDAMAHELARICLGFLQPGEDFQTDRSTGATHLTLAGSKRIHDSDIHVPVDLLLRPWNEYVAQALRAEFVFHRDVHYVVIDGEVQIVDSNTGRIFADRTWQDGLHQAIQAKEGLPITEENQPLAQITRQRFFRLYDRICGMTGTATGCNREFKNVYNLTISEIPLRVPSQRKILPLRSFASSAEKWRAVRQNVLEVHATGRPVLVGTRSIADSECLQELLKDDIANLQLLNGCQDEEEANVVARAGDVNAVTIATNLAGRGTDIGLSDEVILSGGLHVVVAECHESSRVDRQLVGRCARQGHPGSAQTFIAADDSLIRTYGPWLSKSIQRYANAQGEVSLDLSQQVRRLQRLAERTQYAVRANILRRDLKRDSLVGGIETVS